MSLIYPGKDAVFTAGDLIRILSSVDPETEVMIISNYDDGEQTDEIGAVKVGKNLVGLCSSSGMDTSHPRA